jgi:hypothetical protein
VKECIHASSGLTCLQIRVPAGLPRALCDYCKRVGGTGYRRRSDQVPQAPASIAERCGMIRKQAEMLQRIGHSATQQTIDLMQVIIASALVDVADAIEALKREAT